MNQPPSPPAIRGNPRIALWSILGLWVFYFVLNTSRMAMWESESQIDMLGRRTVVSVIGIGITILFYLVLRRFETRTTRQLVTAVFAAAIPVAFAYAAVNHAAFYLISPSAETLEEISKYPDKMKNPWLMIIDAGLNWYFFFVAWGVLWVALAYAERVRHAERQAARYRGEAQSAELRALRYQVNPHFLFNTLNSLSALVLAKRNGDAEKMIINLSTFFRTSLSGDPAADVPLADEIAMQRLYLGIEAVRFPSRLNTVIDIPESLMDVRVPGLILQPLVENAIKHGVARTQRPVTITIRAQSYGDAVHITVEDDGDGNESAPRGTGLGLRNVCDRLAARYGDRAQCHSGPRPGGGYRVSLAVPVLVDA